ncbi:uncharacterized protein [Lepeophtheirus salmonis]|uniref:uncharacterized protein isoform X2 n=1 Tax=Lepeophtheirus salmonis TaxID=72036 RepID=UPI001AE5C61E|nr:nuclear hormone receptor family member nhr-34-like isoform X2 [Lepeophtheirus salmonis]
MGPSSSIKVGKRCTSKIGDDDIGEDLLCRVCRVVEYQFHHYGAYACNRCRAFFRRMVRRQRKGNPPTPCITTKGVPPITDAPICDISLFRGACQACRFLACLNKGMDPSLVLTDEVRTSRYSRSNQATKKINIPRKKQSIKSKKKSLKKENSVPIQSSTNSKFYYDSPVVIAPWSKDIQASIVNEEEEETSIANLPPVEMVFVDEEEEEEDPLVVDDADPIIGGVGDMIMKDHVDRSLKETALDVVSWEDQRSILTSGPDQFSLEELYKFVEEHPQQEYEQEIKPLRFDEYDKGLQTPSFEGLNTPSYDHQLENTVLNFSFSVPEMESSSLLDDMLDN